MHVSSPGAGPAIVIPGAPLLVPELVGAPGDPDADRLRAAVLAAGRWLGERARVWRVVAAEPLTRPDGAGSFAGFGADVLVTGAPGGPSDGAVPDPGWPLPLLIAAWVRGSCAPSVRLIGPDDAPGDGPVGTVFVLDGPNTLTERAPGGHRPEDLAVFDAQVAAVCEGGAADGLDPAWSAAAAAMRGATVDMTYRDAPFGVGYFVATGEPV